MLSSPSLHSLSSLCSNRRRCSSADLIVGGAFSVSSFLFLRRIPELDTGQSWNDYPIQFRFLSFQFELIHSFISLPTWFRFLHRNGNFHFWQVFVLILVSLTDKFAFFFFGGFDFSFILQSSVYKLRFSKFFILYQFFDMSY